MKITRRPELETERLLLRGWRTGDLEPFAEMNADPLVMEHFPSAMTAQETGLMVARIEPAFEEHDFGLFAVEVKSTNTFIGFCGLSVPYIDAPFMPAVEVGWRLAKQHWGNGYATEAARAAIVYGFGTAGLDEIVSFAIPANQRSLKVMERLGMTHDPRDDFDHPRFLDDERLRHHLLYRMTAKRMGFPEFGLDFEQIHREAT